VSDEVLVFVRRGAEWLVLHRSARQGGYWHAVAGGVERDESDADAAARELREEVGLVARPVSLGRSFSYVPEAWEPRSRSGEGPFSVACFLVDAPAAWEPELDWEHDDYRWCATEAAVQLLHWPEPRAVVEELGCAS
jgi:dATP pyrophosphohydrolase